MSVTCYYPKWAYSGSEATISWDVSGYYHYLPAVFIYNDIEELKFQDDILKTYKPTPNLQQAFALPNGNMVMKYSCGQALSMTPFFLFAHTYATLSNNHKADGYSRPYQLSISLGALLIALFGLIFWRRWLLFHFKDQTVATVILLIGLGSNYFEYAGITGAMTHNNLFMLYAMLLVFSHRYYRSPSKFNALLIGGCVGLMALTRPTEILAVLIPIFYGLNISNYNEIKARFNFHKKHFIKLLLAALICFSIGSIQLLYWKYVSGEWLVYSYEDQGFSWLSPHIFSGLFSYNNGWIPYSPIMVTSIVGLPFVLKFDKGRYSFFIVYILTFIYVVFAWDIWWYGGSLGQRTMVQLYPMLSFPFALVLTKVEKINEWAKRVLLVGALPLIYINLWFVYQAHGGGMLYVEQMTKEYYWKTLGTWEKKDVHLSLLDNKDLYEGTITTSKITSLKIIPQKLTSTNCYQHNAISINNNCTYSPTFSIESIPPGKKWLKISALVSTDQKEWNVWRMPQMILQYKNKEGTIVKSNMIRLHRFINNGSAIEVSLDSKLLDNYSDMNIELLFWNVEAAGTTTIKDISLISF